MQHHGRLLATFASVAILLAGSSDFAQAGRQADATVAQKVVGTWLLAAYSSTDPETQRLRGARPTGLIVYDKSGRMSVQIMPERKRRAFTGQFFPVYAGPRPTPDEALDAVMGYTAYFGTYLVDERAGTIIHKRDGNLNPTALGNFVRRYRFVNEDRVVLTPVENDGDQLTWERVK
jgi:hypothetical protein